MNIENVTGLLGGIGLVLVGMWLMTEGLKVAAGPSLKTALERWTNTRLKGLAAGFVLTTLVQFSSAVVIATIGFVNAGVMTLGQAIWVVFGSNVGTTMTAWVVATVGFKVNIQILALPMIGIGMAVRLTAPGTPRGAIGETITGFGLFFLGVAVLKEMFEGLAPGFSLDTLSGGFFQNVLFVLIGFAITSLVQSSSASIAVALSAAAGGLIGLEAGAATVIGANLGSTVPAILAVINATPNAKRVAASHVVFSLTMGGIALALLPIFVAVCEWLAEAGHLPSEPATVLALFHTLFNVCGVILFWFLGERLTKRLQVMFVSDEENDARPHYLDRTLLETPSLGVSALLLELRRLGGLVTTAGVTYLKDPAGQAAYLRRRMGVVARLAETIREYAAMISAERLTAGVPDTLAHILRALQHWNGLSKELQGLLDHAPDEAQFPETVRDVVAHYRMKLVDFLSGPRLLSESDVGWLTETGMSFEEGYVHAKQVILSAAAKGQFERLVHLDDAMREVDLLRRVAHHAVRAAMRINAAEALLAAPYDPDASAEFAAVVTRNE